MCSEGRLLLCDFYWTLWNSDSPQLAELTGSTAKTTEKNKKMAEPALICSLVISEPSNEESKWRE